MKKRIFRSICLAALTVFLASLILIVGMLYNNFSAEQQKQLSQQTELVAQGITAQGAAFIEYFHWDEYRATLISEDGQVLYDTDADTAAMENHLEREEIQEALATGSGESSRYSATLMEQQYYSAKRLPDGSVIRLSIRQRGPLNLMLNMLIPLLMIVAVAVILCLLLASHLTKQIVRPLNSLDLDLPMSNDDYDEILPLLQRIDTQQTQLKDQAERLQRRRREFEAVTGSMAEGLILLGTDGRILSINESAMTLFDAGRHCIGGSLGTICDDEATLSAVQRALSGTRGEALLTVEGAQYQVDVSPIVTDGELSGVAVLLFDVTEKQQAEQMRREFSANVSHELKTPLQSISGYAELMANGLVKPEDTNRFAGKIYAEAQRMILLIEDIIRLSRLDEGPGQEQFEPVDLFSAANAVVAELQPQADAAGISITVEGEPAVINGVPGILATVIRNLCDNAIKYNRPEGSVSVSISKGQGSVRLTVSDSGIGIAPEYQSRIFERFYRVDKSRSKSVGGTGLGLSIVKHGAMLHNARIDLKSTPGRGTTISVDFPV